jgi:hypothetical protein
MTTFAYRPVSKESQLYNKPVKLSQKQMGDISPKVRKEVRLRSGGVCEVKERCNGAPAIQQAHITGRKQLTRKTTAEDLLDSCLNCHKWLDETPEGIRYKRSLIT